ncbi:Alpha/beta hydrolase of unknown function (DUF1400) [Xenococcus sp. PCC 7305]|uniref:alpha/beta hydrolase n=1 Tax=Xenococcus sp. PCC 7305 TaxID=102125 RepID=UPI0002ACCB2F|nr:alpha/beta hydrolase [Xenococcus sp. PCC 7305]ELS02002.1 Alpha/beta hydrolase of unknown function (DUF1400) [Xenococcus sp. PCC 7305]
MLRRKFSQLISLGQILILGVGATLTLSSRANATELITLQYKERSALVTIDDLSRFARSGVVPLSIQELFDTTDKVPSDISVILSKELKISPQFIERFLESSIGEFILGRLEEVINDSPSSGDLNDVRSTLVSAYEDDNRVSLIELIERYPKKEIRVNVTSLEGTYDKVVAIVEDVLPALEVAKAYVQDLVCECEEQVTQLSEDGETILVANNNADCRNYNSIVQKAPRTQDEVMADITARNSNILRVSE